MLNFQRLSKAGNHRGQYLLTLFALALGTACSSGAAPSATVAPAQSAATTTDLVALAAAAKSEGGVKYYTPVLDQTLPSVFEAFTAQYGVPVTMLQLTAAPLV